MAKKFTIDVEAKTNAQDVQKQFGDLRKSINETKESIEGLDKSSENYEKEVRELNAELEKLESSYKELNKANTDLGASFEDVHGEMKPLTGRMGEMEDRLYEMALAGDTASKEYQDLLVEVGKYKKVQQDTDMIVDAAATTMAQKLGGALQGVAGGFAVGQAGMALFGSESEQLEKTMLKVQSAMALVQGMEGLREGAKAFKAMGVQAKLALNGIKTGLIATGIGALIVALGTIVAYWDEIMSYVDGTTEGQREMLEQLDEGDKMLKSQRSVMQQQIELLNAQGATEGEIHKVKLKQLDAEIAQAKLRVKVSEEQKASQIAAAKRNVKILQGILEFLTAPLDKMIDAYNFVARKLKLGEIDRVSKKISQSVSQYFIDVKQISKEAQDSVNDAKNQLTSLEKQRLILVTNFQKQQVQQYKDIIKRRREAADAELAIQREIEDKRSELRKESEQKEIDLAERTKKREIEDLEIRLRDEKINDDQFKKLKTAAEDKLKKDLKDINDKYRLEEELAEKQHQDNLKNIKNEFFNELEAETEIANKRIIGEQEFEINAVRDKYFRLIEMAKQYGLDTTELVENRKASIKAIEKKYEDNKKVSDDKEIADQEKVWNTKLQIANDSLVAINGLVQAFAGEGEEQQRRAFEVNKAVGIAQAIISTAQGVMSQLAVPQDALTGMNFIKAGIISATGVAQVATIAKQKFQASGGNTGGSPTSPSAPTGGNTTPQFNVVGNSNVNQLAQLQMQPTKAFVVSGDVSTAQALDRNKIQNATI